MTCREYESLLADGAPDARIEGHLNECAPCRALREELRENALALSAMREEALPCAAAAAALPRRRFRIGRWMPAAAAAVVLLVAAQQIWRRDPAPPPPVQTEVQAHPAAPVTVTEPLKIKMLTSDPDVVIYWLVDSQEGE